MAKVCKGRGGKLLNLVVVTAKEVEDWIEVFAVSGLVLSTSDFYKCTSGP